MPYTVTCQQASVNTLNLPPPTQLLRVAESSMCASARNTEASSQRVLANPIKVILHAVRRWGCNGFTWRKLAHLVCKQSHCQLQALLHQARSSLAAPGSAGDFHMTVESLHSLEQQRLWQIGFCIVLCCDGNIRMGKGARRAEGGWVCAHATEIIQCHGAAEAHNDLGWQQSVCQRFSSFEHLSNYPKALEQVLLIHLLPRGRSSKGQSNCFNSEGFGPEEGPDHTAKQSAASWHLHSQHHQTPNLVSDKHPLWSHLADTK